MGAGTVQQRNVSRNVGVNLPAPIQRPSQMASVQQHGNFSTLPQQLSNLSQQQQLQQQQQKQQQSSMNDPGDFKKIQRQKMLEDTKNYFQKEQQQIHPSSK